MMVRSALNPLSTGYGKAENLFTYRFCILLAKGTYYFFTTPLVPLCAKNRYQILEPTLDVRAVKPVNKLDIICTPLVAFDNSGQRLGMGGGYYDRTLSQWHQHKQGPYPLGLAHDCQHVEQLPSEQWDVPLPKIITPSKLYCW